MIKPMHLLALFPLTLLMACSSGQDTFYWYRPQTGIQYFAKDHNYCLYDSDAWPYEMPNWNIPPQPEMYDLRLRSEAEDGIWAFYIALPGSQPVYVNSKSQGQWSMDEDDYADCMRDRGYQDMYYPVEDYRIGVKYCTMTGCVDAKDYNSVMERRKDGRGQYEQTYNQRYIGDDAYTSHYYGADSQYFYDMEYGRQNYQYYY